MGEIRAYSKAKKEKIKEKERAERLAATKSSEEAKEAKRLQRLADKEEEKAERTRIEAREDARENNRRADKEREEQAKAEEREHRDSKVQAVDALKLGVKRHLKLCTTKKEDFIRAARVWAEQSRFSLATAITQQRYFQAIIEPEVWARIEKDTGLTTTFEQCIVLVEAVFIESCSPFIRKCGFFSATHGDKEWSDYAESLLSLARLAVLKYMSEKDHVLHKLLEK